MRGLVKLLGRLLLLALASIAVWAYLDATQPREAAVPFDPTVIGPDVDAYFARVEGAFDDIRPGQQKRVVWAGTPNEKTPLAVLYVHGFSASSEEIRPVPDRVAEALGGNLVFTRLNGHGRTSAAMGEATLAAWMEDMGEALAVARAVGEEVIVISTSTGGTLATLAARDAEMSAGIKGHVFVSPNFGINAVVAPILTWPLVRYWGPVLAGKERSFEARVPEHEIYWTNNYPTLALLPMAQAVKEARHLDHGAITLPLLLMYSNEDQVVVPDATRAVATRWGGPVTRYEVTMGPGDDPSSHVIAGDALSPGQTDIAVQRILDWVAGL